MKNQQIYLVVLKILSKLLNYLFYKGNCHRKISGLIKRDRSRIKVFEPFEDLSKPSLSIDVMMTFAAAFIKTMEPVMKGSRRPLKMHE